MARFDTQGSEWIPMGQSAIEAESLFELGIRYATGREVETDLIAAHKWFNLAALKGNDEAAHLRQEIAAELTAAEIAAAQRSAREWMRTH